jgi:hypothetical protein
MCSLQVAALEGGIAASKPGAAFSATVGHRISPDFGLKILGPPKLFRPIRRGLTRANYSRVEDVPR